MAEKPGLIFAAMAKVMAECGAVRKTGWNDHQKYKFRGIDDIYNHLNEVKAKHGVFELPEVLEDRTEERQTSRGGLLLYRILKIRYTFYTTDGSTVTATVIGEGMDSGDKAANKAMTAAHKYALIQAFNIRTDDKSDSENHSHHLAGRGGQQGNQQRRNNNQQRNQQQRPQQQQKQQRPQQQQKQQQPPQQQQQKKAAPSPEHIAKIFNKAKQAFAALGVEEKDMLTFVNKKSIDQITEPDLQALGTWAQKLKGAVSGK